MSNNWSALRSAQSSSSTTRSPRTPNNRVIKDFLLEWGISEEIAAPVSKNELCYWQTSEVQEVFVKLDTTPTAVRDGLRSFNDDSTSTERPLSTPLEGDFLKPDVRLMLQSVEKRAALCVNEAGDFSLQDTDYVAMSHVWIEGVGANLDSRGLNRRLIQSIFSRIRPLGVEWIWLDSLAIPGGVEALSLQRKI